MQDTINRLARGVFDYEPPVMELSEVNIEESIGINSIYSGELRIKSVKELKIKGVVSSTNHAVSMEKATFVGVDNVVTYHVDTRGIKKGESIEGFFNVISNGGELSVPFSFHIVDRAVESSMGNLKNLFHFTNLVQTEPDEAYKLFASDNFETIFLKDDYQLKNRYELLLYGDKPKYLGVKTDVKQCLEEFLISIHKKTPIQLALSSEYKEYLKMTTSKTDSVILTKNTWGAVNVKVSCDNPCIVPETDFIDEDRFAGSKYELRYFIDYSKLHSGKNYARITFETRFQKISMDILLVTEESSKKSNKNRLEVQKNLNFLVESYLSFRIKRINMAQWTKQSLAAIEKIRSIDDEDLFFKLLHAQLLISVRKRNEAEWLIQNVWENLADHLEEYAPLYAYYLYVSSLHKQNAEYAIDALKKVKHLYEDGHDEWQVLWVMFYLDEEYEKNRSLKLARIKEQFYKGCVSPIMYLEAALVFANQPLLLRVFDDFEIQTILFAEKHGLISEKLLMHITEIAENKKTFSKIYWKLLIKLYEKNKSKTFLSIIYKFMVKSETMPKDAFTWIKAAVDADLRITNLYENYLIYCDKTSMAPLPKLLLLYFTYNSTLDYNLRSYLFTNIFYNRYDDPQTYENYKHQMERFVIEQVSKGHINIHLAALYRDLLEPSMINADTSKMLANILFSYRITCDDPNMVSVLVKHKETEEVQTRPLVNHEAYINIFTDEAGIVLCDKDGNRYCGTHLYTCKKVFDGDKYIPLAFKYLQDDLWMSLYFCENGKKYGYSDYDMVGVYKRVIQDSRVSEHYRDDLVRRIIEYFYTDYDGDNFAEEYIYPNVDKLDERSRIQVTETYILNGLYDKAMEIIRKRGAQGLNPKRLLRMCATLIAQVDGEKDEEVLTICETVFKQNKYDEEVLNYLVRYYNCSTKDMVALWNCAKNFDIDTSELEERILYQMMFVQSNSSSMAKIFESYYNKGARLRVVEAYIAYNSYQFFIREVVINPDIFRVIEHRILEEVDTIDICKLALLKFYANDIQTIELTQKQLFIAQKLLDEMVDKKKIFAFYKDFDPYLIVPHEIMDKSIVEYRTNPETQVMIHYVMGGEEGLNEYNVENMENMFEGIFVKQFVLFYGDTIQYYITEHKNNDEELTESGSITNQTVSSGMSQGRYGMINDMLACIELQDLSTMKKMMNGYVISEQLSKTIFKPL